MSAAGDGAPVYADDSLERCAAALERTADALERFALNDNERMETNRKFSAMVESALPAMAQMLKRFSEQEGFG